MDPLKLWRKIREKASGLMGGVTLKIGKGQSKLGRGKF